MLFQSEFQLESLQNSNAVCKILCITEKVERHQTLRESLMVGIYKLKAPYLMVFNIPSKNGGIGIGILTEF